MGRIIEGEANIQGSSAWHAFRSLSLGATTASVLFNSNPWKDKLALYQEMVEGKRTPLNDAMKRGMDMENEAREWIEKEKGMMLPPAVMIHDDIGYIHASFDGINMTYGEAIEIKCPGEKTHQIAKNGKVPDYYVYQLQQQMSVGDLDHIWYCSYNGQDDCVMIKIERDDDMIAQIIINAYDFMKRHVLPKIPPEPSKPVKRALIALDQDSRTALLINLDNREKIVDKIKHLTELKEYLDEQITSVCHGESCVIGKYKITRVESKGQVDWERLAQAYSITPDMLDNHRKPSRSSWRIT